MSWMNMSECYCFLHVPDLNVQTQMSFDPRGRSTVTAGSDHYFCTYRPFVRPSVRPHFFKTKQISSESNVRYWLDCGSGQVDHWWHLSCWRLHSQRWNLALKYTKSIKKHYKRLREKKREISASIALAICNTGDMDIDILDVLVYTFGWTRLNPM